ncbi:hypothetical protein IGI04_027080 [Brassica rapa subsp. trilocularis]|uniref:DUF632 domain-containing protein n=1 Tax=Brassica rapa subsp. trilocularis TaxID=1813537 RepID=A0ABQ7KXY6_BRACM|nr:hypothetical protein IGI04_027080 [Brassica rapa subsp. trilocularis]
MMFCGVLSPLMNCVKPSSSKNISLVRTDMRSRYSSDLKYYTSACQQDSDLKTFDSSLHQRKTSVMKSLADQAAKSQSISQGTLMEVYEFLLYRNRDVYEAVYEEQVLLLEELCKLKAKLDKQQRNVKIWRRLSNVVLSVETGARVNKIATVKIRVQVDKLRIRISSVLETVEFAVEREENEVATILATQEIKKIVDGLTDKIKEVGQHAAMFSGLIALGRLIFLKHIRTLPSNSVS